jgi:hypothetical protein
MSRGIRLYIEVDHDTWRELMRGAIGTFGKENRGTREQAAYVLLQWAKRRIRRGAFERECEDNRAS